MSPTAQRTARDTLLESGIALSRAVTLDRVCQETVQQLRRVLGCRLAALALREPGDDLHLAATAGSDEEGEELDGAAVAHALEPAWHEALERRTLISRDADGGRELTAPLVEGEDVVGAVTVRLADDATPSKRDDSQRLLRAVAAQAAAAIQRVRATRAAEERRRRETSGELAGTLGQELRSPLAGITSAAQLLRFRAREDPVLEKNVGRILREVERLNRITAALVELGHPRPLRLAPHDPDLVWDTVLEAERGRLESSALVIRRERASPPARAAVDVEQLAHAFARILEFLVHAAPEASDLTLVSEVLAGGAWRSRLRAASARLAPEAVEGAFELFTTTVGGGSDIGLALCRRIVEDHGGTIVLESTKDRGTTCTVMLPVRDQGSESGGRTRP